jgi:hypothetical protein
VLLGKRYSFIVDQRGVFNAGDARANCIFYPCRRVRMCCDAQVEVFCFIDRGVEFLGSEFL